MSNPSAQNSGGAPRNKRQRPTGPDAEEPSGGLSDAQSPAPLLLVIEDNDDFAALMTDLLEESGYRSVRVSTFADGRKALKGQRFDAVLLDLGLPDARDMRTWEVIYADDPTVPIIMVTGQNDRNLAARALGTGVQDYIVKTELVGAGLDRAIRYAIERQRLLFEVQKAHDEAAALALRQSVLAKVGRLISSTGDLDGVFEQVSAELARALPFDRLALNLIDWDKEAFAEFLIYGEDLPGRSPEYRQPLAGSVTQSVSLLGETILLNDEDLRQLAPVRQSAKHMLDREYKSLIVAPLISQSHRLGVLIPASKSSGVYNAEAMAFLHEVADHMAGAIGQMQAHRKAVDLAERQSAIAALGRSVTQSLDLDKMLRTSTPFIKQLVPADYLSVNLVKGDSQTVEVRYLGGRPARHTARETQPMAGSVTARVIETRRIINLREELSKPSDRREFATGDLAVQGVRSGLAVPLVVSDRAIGAIIWMDRDPERFTDFDRDIAVTVSIQVAGAIANAELHRRTLQLAKETEERVRLEAANRDLVVSNEIKSQVISNVSHELRTPLTSMLVFADLLHRNREANLTREQLIQTGMIRRGGRLLDLLINDLLTMSRLNSGSFKLDITAFRLSELLDDLVSLMRSVVEIKCQSIVTEVDGGDFEITSDISRLSQVLCNLLSNASKYSPNDTKITVRARREGESLCIAVSDQGAGIPENEREAIFRRFHRINNDATRSEHGTGLGLHIVQSLLQLLGGSIALESEVGKGSTFTVRVPVELSERGLVEAA